MRNKIFGLVLVALISSGCGNSLDKNANQEWKQYTTTSQPDEQFSFSYPGNLSVNESPYFIELVGSKSPRYIIDNVKYDEQVNSDYLKKQSNGFKTMNVEEVDLKGHKAYRITGLRENNIRDAPKYFDYYEEDIVVIENGERHIRIQQEFNPFSKKSETDHETITRIMNSVVFSN